MILLPWKILMESGAQIRIPIGLTWKMKLKDGFQIVEESVGDDPAVEKLISLDNI